MSIPLPTRGFAARIGLPPVMAVGDIADFFKVKPQNVNGWTATSDWPQPFATLKAGRVWLTDAVLAWAYAHGRYPACAEDLVAPLLLAEPRTAHQVLLFETAHVDLTGLQGIVQIRRIDTVHDLDYLAVPHTMAVWLEGPADRLPTPRTRDVDNALVFADPGSATGGPAHLVAPLRNRCDVTESNTDLQPGQTRVTIAVRFATRLSGTMQQAKLVVADTHSPLNITGHNLTVQAGYVGPTRLTLAGTSSAELRRVEGAHLHLTHNNTAATKVLAGDVDQLDLHTEGQSSIVYGGHATEATRLVNDGTGAIAVNDVTRLAAMPRGNVYIHVPPPTDPSTFWDTWRTMAVANS